MDWCDLDHKGKYRLRDLKSLESELNYMKEHGYLGNWTNSGDNAFLSNCTDPFTCSLTLTPPQWLDQELKVIQSNRELPSIEDPEEKLLTLKELQREISSKNRS